MTEDTDAKTLGMRPADDRAGRGAGVPGPADGLVAADVVTLRDALEEAIGETWCAPTSGGTDGVWCMYHDRKMVDTDVCEMRAGWVAAVRADATRARTGGHPMNDEVTTLRDALLYRRISHTTYCVVSAPGGRPNAASCTCGYARDLAALIAAVRADATRAAEAEVAGLRKVALLMARHTHDSTMGSVVSYRCGKDPSTDCLLCRALVAAGVLTLGDIGAGTRAALAAQPAPEAEPERCAWTNEDQGGNRCISMKGHEVTIRGTAHVTITGPYAHGAPR